MFALKAFFSGLWGFLRDIPLAAWVFAALWMYHEYALYERGVEDRARFERQVAAAETKAKADHDALQAKVDAKAGPSNADLKAQFDKIQSQLKTLSKPSKPLPADCKYDDERVKAANKALSQ